MKTMRLTVYSLAIALGIGTLSSCGDDDENNNFTLPPIGGYNTSDEIASNNLVAKWSFEGNTTESKTGTAGTATNAAFTAGAKGQAWEGSSSQARYAIYNGLTGVGGVSNFTVAFWMNSAGTVANGDTAVQGQGTQGIFSLVKPDQFWGGINVFLENPNADFPNRLRLKYLIENKRTGVVWQSYSPLVNIDDSMNEWIHVVLTYNASTSKLSSYINGIAATSVEGPYSPEGGFPGSYIAYANDPGDLANVNGAALWGDIDFGGSYSQVVLGSHQFTTTPSLTSAHGTEPWSTTYAGKLDEFRVYNSALSGSDVGALYELEKAGR
jgi:hypothetical protein